MDTITPDQRFEQLELTLPPPPKPLGVYKPFMIVDRFAYVSGHGTITPDGGLIIGKVGVDLDADQAKIAARQVGLAILATLRANLRSLDRVRRVIKVLGMVNATPDFERHPFVINGCSELFASVWGDDLGVGVRSAIGVGSLPDNIPVEIEAIFELS